MNLDATNFFAAPTTAPLNEDTFGNLTEALTPKPSMTEDQFWALVEVLDWEEHRKERGGYKDIKFALLRNLTPGQVEVFRDWVFKKKAEVWEALDTIDTSNHWIGGDSGDDLTAHIVGCGREVFEAETANPKLILERLDRGDYTESFAYCIPYEGDYKRYSVEKLSEWGSRLVKAVDDACEEAPEWAEAFGEKLTRYREIFETVANGDLEGFLALEEEGRELSESLEKVAPNSLGGGWNCYDSDSEARSLKNKWAAWNLFTDASDSLRVNG